MCDMYIDMLRQRPCLFVVVVVAISNINNQKNGETVLTVEERLTRHTDLFVPVCRFV